MFKNVEMKEVNSSNIDSVGYEDENRKLYVKFRDSSIYCYSGVDKHFYYEMCKAGSVGSYFSNNIKDNFRFEKI